MITRQKLLIYQPVSYGEVDLAVVFDLGEPVGLLHAQPAELHPVPQTVVGQPAPPVALPAHHRTVIRHHTQVPYPVVLQLD